MNVTPQGELNKTKKTKNYGTHFFQRGPFLVPSVLTG